VLSGLFYFVINRITTGSSPFAKASAVYIKFNIQDTTFLSQRHKPAGKAGTQSRKENWILVAKEEYASRFLMRRKTKPCLLRLQI
jgi:hypothetical protein